MMKLILSTQQVHTCFVFLEPGEVTKDLGKINGSVGSLVELKRNDGRMSQVSDAAAAEEKGLVSR